MFHVKASLHGRLHMRLGLPALRGSFPCWPDPEPVELSSACLAPTTHVMPMTAQGGLELKLMCLKACGM